MPDPNLFPKADYCLSSAPKTNKGLADELSALHTQQLLALKTAAFIPMSTKETQEYEQRSGRIRTIYRELVL
jgi:hypothetical protein